MSLKIVSVSTYSPLDRLGWAKILEESDRPFSELQIWLGNKKNLKDLMVSQDTPVTLLGPVHKNEAIFTHLDEIHQCATKDLKPFLDSILKAIKNRNWVAIDWDWSMSINDNEVLDQFIHTKMKSRWDDPDYLDFGKHVDICELGNYLYLKNQITDKELMLVHIMKCLHYTMLSQGGYTGAEYSRNHYVVMKYPVTDGRGGVQVVDGRIPYYVKNLVFSKIYFSELFQKDSNEPLSFESIKTPFLKKIKAEMQSKKDYDNFIKFFYLELSKNLTKMVKTYGVNLEVLMKDSKTELEKFNSIMELFIDSEQFKILPTLGIYPTELYYAASIYAERKTGKFTRFVGLPHPCLINRSSPHVRMSTLSLLAHDGVYYKFLKKKDMSHVKQESEGYSFEELTYKAKNEYPEKLELQEKSHLTDFYN